jgi:hypothetical protein
LGQEDHSLLKLHDRMPQFRSAGRSLHRHQLRSRRTTQGPQKKRRLTSGVARPAGRQEWTSCWIAHPKFLRRTPSAVGAPGAGAPRASGKSTGPVDAACGATPGPSQRSACSSVVPEEGWQWWPERGRIADARRLIGAAEGLLQVVGASVHDYYQPDRSLYKRPVSAPRSRLGDATFEAAREDEGRSMIFEQAVAYALEVDEASLT